MREEEWRECVGRGVEGEDIREEQMLEEWGGEERGRERAL